MTDLHAEPQALDGERSKRLAALVRYDQAAPRYATYPTMGQFSPDVGPEQYAGWLSALAPDRPLSLYVHLPPLPRLYRRQEGQAQAFNQSDPVSDYVARLIDELALIEKRLPHRPRVKAIHLGGVANALSRDDLVALFFAIRHVFAVGPAATIAAELDPATLTQVWVRAAVFHGLCQATLRVGTLAMGLQTAIDRHPSLDQLARATAWLREAGVASIGFELAYGLPRQTVADVEQTLGRVLALRPDRLALLAYPHTPGSAARREPLDAAGLAEATARLDQQSAAQERLIASGYCAIGPDHYALPADGLALAAAAGTLRRTVHGYTADPPGPLIGVGVSAIGNLPQGLVQNIADEQGWRAALFQGRLPVARGATVSSEDRLRGAVIERLMCDGAVDLVKICQAHGRPADHLAAALSRLTDLQDHGLVVVDGGRVSVSAAGRPFLRLVARAFDLYAHEEPGLSLLI